MKYLLNLIILLIAFPTFAQHDHDFCDKDLNSIIENERRRGEMMINARSSNLNNNYDITATVCEWNIDPAVYFISGKVTTTFTPTQANIESIEFDLYNNMAVSEILFEGNVMTFNQTTDNILHIDFAAPLDMNQSYAISIEYSGAPESAGFGSFNQTTHGTDNTPILWTLSEPYGASTWWPCKQDLTDKIEQIDIHVTVPVGNKVGSNGLLVETTTNGDNVTYHWSHNHPITTYLVAIAVTNYVEYTDIVEMPSSDDITVLNYVYPETLENAQANTPAIAEMIQLFSDKFGLYPFADEKYGHAQFPWGGGMEHQTMSFMVNYSFGLMAHELAHQWFGDDVTCGSWEDLWLNESFATYLTGLAVKNIQGENEFQTWKWNVISNVTSQPGGSVWVDDTTNVARLFNGRLTYQKGAFVLHMMRWVAGDEDFFTGITNYKTNFAGGYAITDDLKFEIENATGLDYTEFLADWFYGQGYPTYNIDVKTSLGSTNAIIDVFQTTSHNSVDFFEMPIPIKFTFDDGTDSIYVFDHTSSGQTFFAEFPMPITAATFDPDLKILSKNDNTNLIFVVGTDNILSDSKFHIYPNPTTDQLNIINRDPSLKTELFEIYDLTGKPIVNTANIQGNTINTSSLVPGLYFLKITTDKGLLTKRFFVE